MNAKRFSIRGKVIKYPGPGGWFFVHMDKQVSAEIRKTAGGKTVGWGYVKVRATIGNTSWDTTLFPAKEKIYLIAIKSDVRKSERIKEGDSVFIEFVVQ